MPHSTIVAGAAETPHGSPVPPGFSATGTGGSAGAIVGEGYAPARSPEAGPVDGPGSPFGPASPFGPCGPCADPLKSAALKDRFLMSAPVSELFLTFDPVTAFGLICAFPTLFFGSFTAA